MLATTSTTNHWNYIFGFVRSFWAAVIIRQFSGENNNTQFSVNFYWPWANEGEH